MIYHQPVKTYIFEQPQPFASCHASTLVVLPDGDILVAWFGGSKEGAGDVAIWCSTYEGKTWSPPCKVAGQPGIPHWNPVLFQAENGPIYLFYKAGKRIPTWQTMVMTSEDGGHTWSTPRQLVPGDHGGRGPVKNKPIQLADGTWLAPASVESEVWDAFVDISRDQGQTWTKSQLVPIQHIRSETQPQGTAKLPVPAQSFQGKGIIQPTLWESAPGCVHMLLRSTAGRIYRSDSQDGGQTWCPAYPTALPNNNSGIDLTQLPNGDLVLAYNPVGENRGKRTPLVLKISQDNGHTWDYEYVLEKDEGEYSYPAIVSRGNAVYLTYTWKRERITFWKMAIYEQKGEL